MAAHAYVEIDDEAEPSWVSEPSEARSFVPLLPVAQFLRALGRWHPAAVREVGLACLVLARPPRCAHAGRTTPPWPVTGSEFDHRMPSFARGQKFGGLGDSEESLFGSRERSL